MKLISRYFSFEGADDRWDRMAEVLRRSCDACGVRHDVQQMETPQRIKAPSLCANHAKLKAWRDTVEIAEEPLILADTDIFIQRNPEEAFDLIADIGITYRDQKGGPPLPLNGGVVFVNPTKTAKQFFRDWCAMDEHLYRNAKALAKWVRIYGGLNQGSLGALLDTGRYAATRLDCSAWNLVEPWDNVDDAHIVHIKGDSMRHIFDGERPKYESVTEIKKRWEAFENDLT